MLDNSLRRVFLVIAAVVLLVQPAAQAEDAAPANLPGYQPLELEENTLTSVGSDSMDELLQLWVKGYRQYQPSVTVQVTSQGSASAPPALVEGFADIGPMARQMKESEVTEFQQTFGFQPTRIRTALSGIAVYVSESNPLESITFADLDRIYSSKPRRGAGTEGSIETWSSMGIEGTFAEEPIMTLMRGKGTFPYGYFKQRVLLQEDFSEKAMPIAAMPALLELVAANPGAIGFGEITRPIEGVKVLPIQRSKSSKAGLPSMDSMLAGEYPLGRFLNIYVVRFPGKAVDPAARDFLNFVLSREGQQIAMSAGLMPLPADIVKAERAKLK